MSFVITAFSFSPFLQNNFASIQALKLLKFPDVPFPPKFNGKSHILPNANGGPSVYSCPKLAICTLYFCCSRTL